MVCWWTLSCSSGPWQLLNVADTGMIGYHCRWQRVDPEYSDLLFLGIHLLPCCIIHGRFTSFWNFIWLLTFEWWNTMLCVSAISHAGCNTNRSLQRPNLPTMRYCNTPTQECNAHSYPWNENTLQIGCVWSNGFGFIASMLLSGQKFPVSLHYTIKG